MEDLWVTIAEAARLTGRSHSTIFRYVESGRLKARRSVGGIWLVYLPALLEYKNYIEKMWAQGHFPALARRQGKRAFLGWGEPVNWQPEQQGGDNEQGL